MTEPTSAPPTASDAQLAALGIIRIPADVFEVGGYRYSNAKDAIASAQRMACTANDA
jgi:hypothetical protein